MRILGWKRPSPREPQIEPPARKNVDRRKILGDADRVVQGQEDRGRADPDPTCPAGEMAMIASVEPDWVKELKWCSETKARRARIAPPSPQARYAAETRRDCSPRMFEIQEKPSRTFLSLRPA